MTELELEGRTDTKRIQIFRVFVASNDESVFSCFSLKSLERTEEKFCNPSTFHLSSAQLPSEQEKVEKVSCATSYDSFSLLHEEWERKRKGQVEGDACSFGVVSEQQAE